MPCLPCTAEPFSVHPGITCMGCQGQIIGLRLKCAVCLGYELCECCFRAGRGPSMHSSHDEQTHAWFLIRAPIEEPQLATRFGSLYRYVRKCDSRELKRKTRKRSEGALHS